MPDLPREPTWIQEGRRVGPFVSTRQVAGYLGVQPATVRRWIYDGRLPAIQLCRRGQFRVLVQDVDHLRRDLVLAATYVVHSWAAASRKPNGNPHGC